LLGRHYTALALGSCMYASCSHMRALRDETADATCPCCLEAEQSTPGLYVQPQKHMQMHVCMYIANTLRHSSLRSSLYLQLCHAYKLCAHCHEAHAVTAPAWPARFYKHPCHRHACSSASATCRPQPRPAQWPPRTCPGAQTGTCTVKGRALQSPCAADALATCLWLAGWWWDGLPTGNALAC
jgi:hypothetical protein